MLKDLYIISATFLAVLVLVVLTATHYAYKELKEFFNRETNEQWDYKFMQLKSREDKGWK